MGRMKAITSGRSKSLGRRAFCLAALVSVGVLFFLMQIPSGYASEPDGEARERAREHFEQGAEFFFEERYGRALVEFRRAHRLDPHPMILYNKSLAHLRLENTRESYNFAVAAHEMGGLPPAESVRNIARIRGFRVAMDAEGLAETIAAASAVADLKRSEEHGDDGVDVPQQREVESAGMSGLGWTGVVLTGLGAGLLTYAGIVDYQLGGKIEEFESTTVDEEFFRLRDEIDRDIRNGEIALYSGAGLAVLGVTFWILGRNSSSSAPSEVQLIPHIAPETGSGFLQLNGRF